MIVTLYLFIELSAILLMLWALHGSKKKPGIYTIIYICFSLIIEDAIVIEGLPSSFAIIIYTGIVLLDVLEFHDSVKQALLYSFFDILVSFVIQCILGMMVAVLLHINSFDTYKALIVQILFFIITFIIYCNINFSKICKILINNNKISSFLLIILVIISIIYALQFHLRDMVYWENFIYIALFFIVVLALFFEWQRENYINKQKTAELELFHQYNSIYQDFILNMRKKQHDFDNHLQAVFSMNIAATDLDSLVKQQNAYCEELLENNRDSIFLKEDVNSVYLAFLYTKKRKAESLGIEVRYRFDCHDIESHISFTDFITVVGNLFDNATEAVKDEKHKVIILDIIQSEASVLIRVCNTYSFSEGEMPADFFRGKSKKGEGHGLGLSNVTDIVKQYHGIMENTFEYIEQEKFYKISLQLFWKEK